MIGTILGMFQICILLSLSLVSILLTVFEWCEVPHMCYFVFLVRMLRGPLLQQLSVHYCIVMRYFQLFVQASGYWDTIATLFIHFGGKLVEGPHVSYIGGRVATASIIDKVSYFDIVDIIYELGCPKHIKVFYQLLEISANKSLGELQCDGIVYHVWGGG